MSREAQRIEYPYTLKSKPWQVNPSLFLLHF